FRSCGAQAPTGMGGIKSGLAMKESLMAERFEASVQYNDWVGSAAADDQMPRSLTSLLEERGLLPDGKFVVGATFYSGEQFMSVRAVVIDSQWYDHVPDALAAGEPLTSVRVDISAEEFLALFKRFDVAIHRRGLDIAGREFEEPE